MRSSNIEIAGLGEHQRASLRDVGQRRNKSASCSRGARSTTVGAAPHRLHRARRPSWYCNFAPRRLMRSRAGEANPTVTFSGLFDLQWWVYPLVALGLTHATIAAVTIYLHRHQTHRAL